jgi:hypothetical protein
MRLTAAARDSIRRLAGALLISLGTAVFSGAVAVVVDALINDKTIRWAYALAFTAAGLLLSGSGAWLLATLRAAAGLSITTMDAGGDPDRYQDEADAFARFGESAFTALTSLQATVEHPADLRPLRSRVLAALRTLTQTHRRITVIGLHFQGRPFTGFYLGTWLNVAGRRIDLYADARDGASTHFPAVRLTPAIRTPPRALDIAVHPAADTTLPGSDSVSVPELRELLGKTSGQCLALAINLNGPADEAGFVDPVVRSAQAEGAAAVVVVALPASAQQPSAPRRELAPSRQEYESAVAAILAAADTMPASPGLLYFKTPASIPVALGHFLRAGNWIPMRHIRKSGTYERVADPSRK